LWIESVQGQGYTCPDRQGRSERIPRNIQIVRTNTGKVVLVAIDDEDYFPAP